MTVFVHLHRMCVSVCVCVQPGTGCLNAYWSRGVILCIWWFCCVLLSLRLSLANKRWQMKSAETRFISMIFRKQSQGHLFTCWELDLMWYVGRLWTFAYSLLSLLWALSIHTLIQKSEDSTEMRWDGKRPGSMLIHAHSGLVFNRDILEHTHSLDPTQYTNTYLCAQLVPLFVFTVVHNPTSLYWCFLVCLSNHLFVVFA